MEIKDLNKQQLLLLAVLLSFITSIATGITTVTLMQQAPTSFTAPVNRVIQQTVEKIQQIEGKTTVQTVIIKEEDLVVDAIAKNKSAVFSITTETQDENSNTIEVSAGRGFAVSQDGTIVVDGNLVFDNGVYYAQNESGKFKADFVSKDAGGFSVMKIGSPLNGTDKLTVAIPTFGDLDKMKAGQKILVFGDTISSFIFEGNKNIKLDAVNSNGGAIVLDLDGNVLGIASSLPALSFVPINVIIETLKLPFKEGEMMSAAPILAPGAGN